MPLVNAVLRALLGVQLIQSHRCQSDWMCRLYYCVVDIVPERDRWTIVCVGRGILHCVGGDGDGFVSGVRGVEMHG